MNVLHVSTGCRVLLSAHPNACSARLAYQMEQLVRTARSPHAVPSSIPCGCNCHAILHRPAPVTCCSRVHPGCHTRTPGSWRGELAVRAVCPLRPSASSDLRYGPLKCTPARPPRPPHYESLLESPASASPTRKRHLLRQMPAAASRHGNPANSAERIS
ncbi:hypothetical protein BU16DRAFT_235939 [Lophium mytilinum]|uniref:Uncharacterized protein n=1 Tax=Lophium mytilinum TaxID=390894 RepID=A0A6A6R8K7_9PEZI|nr:hypothetical protein BU16DRAFT_235939 [Lophium mytilinum]